MLQFFAGLKVILAGGDFRFLPDAVTPAEGGQSGIGYLGASAYEFFMDPDQIAFVTGQQFQDLNPISFGFLGTDQHGYCW